MGEGQPFYRRVLLPPTIKGSLAPINVPAQTLEIIRRNAYNKGKRGTAMLKKRPNESYLFWIQRNVLDYFRDKDDFSYWASILAMASAASLAVAFIEFNGWAAMSGIVLAIWGLKIHRKTRG